MKEQIIKILETRLEAVNYAIEDLKSVRPYYYDIDTVKASLTRYIQEKVEIEQGIEWLNTLTQNPVPCDYCEGTGLVYISCCGDDMRGQDIDLCPTCGGHQGDDGEPCDDCGGTGFILNESL